MKNILMNTEMTKAILDGRKTQTRRVIKDLEPRLSYTFLDNEENEEFYIINNAKYQIGETIWVREPVIVLSNSVRLMDNNINIEYEYLADGTIGFMDIPERIKKNKTTWYIEGIRGIPNGCIKEMARIFLKVTNVRVERIQDISYEDIVAEGFDVTLHDGTKGQLKKEAFKWWINLLNKTAPKGAKYNNGVYVFVYEFERVDK